MSFSAQRLPSKPNTTHWINAGLMLGHRLRRWANIKPALIQCVVLHGSIHGPRPLRRLGATLVHVRTRACLTFTNLCDVAERLLIDDDHWGFTLQGTVLQCVNGKHPPTATTTWYMRFRSLKTAPFVSIKRKECVHSRRKLRHRVLMRYSKPI